MYESFFGCKEEPFKMTPDPRYFYLSRRHMEALSCLHYGVQKRKGFIEITGEVGSGKTMLCRCFLAQLDSSVKHALIVNPCLSEADILKSIIDDFGITTKMRSRKDYFDAINKFLLEEAAKGNNVLVVIDEAQDLDVRVLEQIRLLSNLETESEKLIQIVFFGQPEFRDVLRKPSMVQLRQRISIRYHLTALSPEEVKEYVYHRLKIAEVTAGSVVVTPKAFQFIYEYTKGIPRIINVLFDKILLGAFVNGSKQITYQLVEEAIAEVEGDHQAASPFREVFDSEIPAIPAETPATQITKTQTTNA